MTSEAAGVITPRIRRPEAAAISFVVTKSLRSHFTLLLADILDGADASSTFLYIITQK